MFLISLHGTLFFLHFLTPVFESDVAYINTEYLEKNKMVLIKYNL